MGEGVEECFQFNQPCGQLVGRRNCYIVKRKPASQPASEREGGDRGSSSKSINSFMGGVNAPIDRQIRQMELMPFLRLN